MSKKRIGLLSYWGFPRGLSYGTLMYVKMLKDEYDIYILKQYSNPISEEFKYQDVKISEFKEYVVPKEFFISWIKDNKLDAIIFNEYKQWTSEPDNLVKEAKKLGCKTYGYLVMERFEPHQTKDYDRIIAPTVTYTRFMRKQRIRNFTYIPHSIDLNEFPKRNRIRKEKFTFFHPGGFGGVYDRKGTQKVIEAFYRLNMPETTKLVITSQKKLDIEIKDGFDIEIIDKEIPRKDFIQKYYEADATVLPSKWETVGLSILESMAAGTPVITTDAPPMNEFVRVGLNGYLCPADFISVDGITIRAAEASITGIKTAMENVMNPMVYGMLSRNCRYIAEKIYDIELTKKYFLNFLKSDLK